MERRTATLKISEINGKVSFEKETDTYSKTPTVLENP